MAEKGGLIFITIYNTYIIYNNKIYTVVSAQNAKSLMTL